MSAGEWVRRGDAVRAIREMDCAHDYYRECCARVAVAAVDAVPAVAVIVIRDDEATRDVVARAILASERTLHPSDVRPTANERAAAVLAALRAVVS